MQKGWLKKLIEEKLPRTIRAQILFGFIFITIITTLGISLSTSLVNYSFSRRQVLKQLHSAQALKEIELRDWALEQQNILLIALNDSATPERLSIVLDLARSNLYYSWYNEAVRIRLQNLVQQSKGLVDLCLLDVHGQVVLCTSARNVSGNCSGEGFFTKGVVGEIIQLPATLDANKIDELSSSSGEGECPIASLNDRDHYAYVSRPVVTQNEFLGVVVAKVSADGLDRILSSQTGLGLTGRAYLITEQRNILYKVGNKPSLETEYTNLFESVSVSRGEGEASEVFPAMEHTGNNGGQHTFSVYSFLPGIQAILVVEQESTEIFQSIQVSLLLSLVVAVCAALAAFLLGAFVARNITRPLENLVETSSAISTGDLNRTAAIPDQVELGALARAFNSMTNQLRDLIANLEARVGERTAALQAANTRLQNQTARLEAGAELSRQITSILDLDDLLIRVVTLIRDTLGYSHARVFLLKGDELALRAFTPGIAPRYTEISLAINSLNTLAVKTNQPVISNDVNTDERFLEEGNPGEIGSEVAIPLVVGERILGTLDVISSQQNAFSSEDIRVIQSLADQIAVAIENTYLYQRSRELAIVEERNRLARDLHDSVLQNLYSLNLLSEGWRRKLRLGEAENVEQYFERIGDIARQALKEMRLMVYQLHTSPAVWEGLVETLERRLAAVESRSGIKVSFEAEENFHLPAEIENNLFFIAQEALNNILKHSKANQVIVALKSSGNVLRLEISDNGLGFDPEACCPGGMGMADMRLRADEIGGALSIASAPGAGTRVTVEVGLQPAREQG